MGASLEPEVAPYAERRILWLLVCTVAAIRTGFLKG